MEVDWDGVIESHYLETEEGLFFAVKGLVHPPDRYLACLRYVPDDEGDRARAGRRYRRMYHFAEQEAFLRSRHPQYIAFDPASQATLQSVPRASICRVYDPCGWLAALCEQGGGDPLAEEAVAFAALLADAADVPFAAFGVSGSLLLGLHRAGSDLDLTVYGRQNCLAVHAALHRLLDGEPPHPVLRRLDPGGVQRLYGERSADTHMAFADFRAVEAGKVNQGQFRGRPYFVRFVLWPGERDETYGARRYTPVGWARVLATIHDASECIFTPCRYTLDDVQFTAGGAVSGLREIVSFRGRFCEQASTGARVLASGTLERVEAAGSSRWHRLLLGNHADDTLLPES